MSASNGSVCSEQHTARFAAHGWKAREKAWPMSRRENSEIYPSAAKATRISSCLWHRCVLGLPGLGAVRARRTAGDGRSFLQFAAGAGYFFSGAFFFFFSAPPPRG